MELGDKDKERERELQFHIRVLLSQESTARRFNSYNQLQYLVNSKDSQNLICKNVEKLLPLEQLLHDRNIKFQRNGVTLLSSIGIAVSNDVNSLSLFINWILKKLNSETAEYQLSLLQILKNVVKGVDTKKMLPLCDKILDTLKTLLDITEEEGHVQEITELISAQIDEEREIHSPLLQLYAKYFQDIVDLLIGWNLSTDLASSTSKSIAGNAYCTSFCY